MNKKIMAGGIAVALGLSGLAWKVIEDEINSLQSRALNRDISAVTVENPSKRVQLQQESKELMERADKYERIQKLIPLTYIVPYLRRFYYEYMVQESKTIKQS